MQEEVQTQHRIKVLNKKYTHERKINEKAMSKTKTPTQKAFSIIFDIVCVILVLFMGMFCFSILNSKSQKTPASVFGYYALKIASPSMEASGFKVGDCVMVHAVDTNTLSIGNIIAFYAYNSAVDTPIELPPQENKPVYTNSIMQFFGIQPKEIKRVASSGARLTFHEIVGIYEDINHHKFFRTKGTSNSSEDVWYISQNHVLGIYVNSKAASNFSGILNSAGSSWLILVSLLIPVLLLAFIILKECFKDVQIAKLELDCIEEKRKITDPICVKNKVGFNMDRKSKYKILATASEEEKMQYVKLLWPEDKIPHCVRKYYLKRGAMLLGPLQKLRNINRKCEQMYKDGTDLKKIGAYYEKERAKIDEELKSRYKRIMKLK